MKADLRISIKDYHRNKALKSNFHWWLLSLPASSGLESMNEPFSSFSFGAVFTNRQQTAAAGHNLTLPLKLRLRRCRNAAFTRQQHDLSRCCRLKTAFRGQGHVASAAAGFRSLALKSAARSATLTALVERWLSGLRHTPGKRA